MKLLVFLSVVSVMLVSCIEQFNVPVITSTPRVVVDGMITSDPGPYTVELYMSSRINENLNEPVRITGAVVSIWDDDGNSEILIEESAGVYKTQPSGLQGTVGKSYQLKFTTPDGTAYESIPAKLQPAGQIENLYFEFKRNELNSHDLSLPQDAILVYADAKGVEGSPNLFRWRWSSTFHISTSPNLHTKEIRLNGTWVEVPDPLPCSIPDCLCCNCWVPQNGNSAIISNNQSVNGINFNRIMLTKIAIDEWVFSHRYHYFAAEQISVQPEVYDFWKLVTVQQQGGNNIFQTNAVSVKGNIECVNDEKKAYGIFSVSAIARKDFYMDSALVDEVPYRLELPSDCKSVFKNASYEKPAFWYE